MSKVFLALTMQQKGISIQSKNYFHFEKIYFKFYAEKYNYNIKTDEEFLIPRNFTKLLCHRNINLSIPGS